MEKLGSSGDGLGGVSQGSFSAALVGLVYVLYVEYLGTHLDTGTLFFITRNTYCLQYLPVYLRLQKVVIRLVAHSYTLNSCMATWTTSIFFMSFAPLNKWMLSLKDWVSLYFMCDSTLGHPIQQT